MEKISNVYILANGKCSDMPCDIVIDDGIISDILPSDCKTSDRYATAGYIDVHTHGGYGHDYFECTQQSADAVGKFHLDNGTTSYFATSVATPLEVLDANFKSIRNLKNKYANMLGIHIEGPYISLAKKGAQPKENIKTTYKISDGVFFEKNKDILRTVTLCPHTKNAVKLVRKLKKCHIVPQAGHDDSILPEIATCVKAGINGTTHLYCASSGLRRIEGDLTKYLGLNEYTLANKKMFAEVIADGMHISKELFLFILQNKGYKHIMFVSDSLACAGMDKGNYMLGTSTKIINNGTVALLEDGKTIAGSITPLKTMVKNAVSYGVPIAKAVYMANQAPATYHHLDKLGVIKVGNIADINILDREGNLIKTFKANV